MPQCRFEDGSPAVARLSTPRGCVCFPEDREQDLCAQHIVKWGIFGDAEIIKVYNGELAERLGILPANEAKERSEG